MTVNKALSKTLEDGPGELRQTHGQKNRHSRENKRPSLPGLKAQLPLITESP